MKKLNFSNRIVVLAVVLGVFFVSAGVVFGNNPLVNPPGNGVNPTFTGLTVSGNSTVGNLNITGNLNNPGGDLTITDDTLTIDSNTLIQDWLHVDDGVSTNGDLSAGGNITTSLGKIGKFYRYRSPGLIALPATNLGVYVSSCPVGITVSCSVQPVSSGAITANYAGLGVSPTVNANGINGCQPKFYNSSAQNLQVYAWNVCFDATGTALGNLYSVLAAGSLTP